MSIADKVQQRRTERQLARTEGASTPISSARSTLVLAEPAHIRRLKGVMTTLHNFIQTEGKGSGIARMAFFMQTVTDELIDEMKDYDELSIRGFMFQIGEAISWIGHGDNERVPANIRPFVEQIQPSEAKEKADGTDSPVPAIAQTR